MRLPPFGLLGSFFCVALLPVMGFCDVGFMKYSLVADRYLHLALLAVLVPWRQGLELPGRS